MGICMDELNYFGALGLIALLLFSGCAQIIDDNAYVWMSYKPVQCNGNPWDAFRAKCGSDTKCIGADNSEESLIKTYFKQT